MHIQQRVHVFVLNMQIATVSIYSKCVREGDQVRINVKQKVKEETVIEQKSH